jgi:7,8-dihydroneopterin aldolase/epimerase/oxygenase
MNAIDSSIFERFPEQVDNGARHAGEDPMRTMDIIFIEGFEGETVIGIDPEELHHTQPVRIDLWAGLPRSRACETDRIADTLDYGKIHGALEALLAAHGVQLLEALAETIAQSVLVDFGAHWVRVSLVKPRKFPNVKAVGVTIERHRQQPGDGVRRHEKMSLALLGAGMFPPSTGV